MYISDPWNGVMQAGQAFLRYMHRSEQNLSAGQRHVHRDRVNDVHRESNRSGVAPAAVGHFFLPKEFSLDLNRLGQEKRVQELIYKAFVKALSKGNAYCLQVLADRGYGKLKETVRHERGPLEDVPTPDLEAHIQELESKLIANLVERGYTITKPPQLLPPATDEPKPN